MRKERQPDMEWKTDRSRSEFEVWPSAARVNQRGGPVAAN